MNEDISHDDFVCLDSTKNVFVRCDDEGIDFDECNTVDNEVKRNVDEKDPNHATFMLTNLVSFKTCPKELSELN